jgi:hypothetical protein
MLCVIVDEIGDELYEAEFYEELPEESTIEAEVQHIIVQLLRDFSFLNENQEYDSGVDEEEEGRAGDMDNSPNKISPHLKSNYFKKQLQKMAGNIGLAKGINNDIEDDISEVTARVFTHPTLKGVSDSIDNNRLCEKRGFMEKIAVQHQKKQGEAVNRRRAKDTKPVLDVGDIGLIEVEGNTRAATDHKWLPVMVTSTRLVSPGNVMYKLCTQHGYLVGEYVRGVIYPHETMTAEMLKINPLKPKFEQDLSIATASAKYNALGGAKVCRCTSNCLKSKRCCCMALGKLCSAKCHGKRKDGKVVPCENCYDHVNI